MVKRGDLGSGKLRDILRESILKNSKILIYQGRGKLFLVVRIVGSVLLNLKNKIQKFKKPTVFLALGQQSLFIF